MIKPTGEFNGLVLVNGPADSVQGPRARALFGDMVPIVYKDRGRFGSLKSIASALRKQKRGWVYCIDMGFPAALLAALRKMLSSTVRLVYEIGDPSRPLLANQSRPWWEITLAHQVDRCLPSIADQLVFRGSFLAGYFEKMSMRQKLPAWMWLPDGVDCDMFQPQRSNPDVTALRQAYNLEGRFVVGLVGNIHHNPVHNLFYGWELAEALALIPSDLPITGVVVGDGPGRHVLETARARLKLQDRLLLVGRVPHREVPRWMNVFDVALSTQTDDPVGWGRTTAKLPEYLACGTPVLCTDVGEAHRWLKDNGQTLPYRGLRDEGYPARLAKRLQEMVVRDLSPLRSLNRDLAVKLFDYKVLQRQVCNFLNGH